MAKIKYFYNSETCKYEKVKPNKWDLFVNALFFLSSSLLLSLGIVVLFGTYFNTPKETQLIKENKQLKIYYDILNKKLKSNNEVLSSLESKDDNIYRLIFEAEPIDKNIREGGIGGVERHRDILEENLEQKDLILNLFNSVEEQKKKMYIQSKSYDEIIALANKKEELWASIPAIQPIHNKELKRLSSGYGMRWHPILKRKRMHYGLDYSAPRGTPVYSTGNGKVIKVKRNYGGYGNQIVIDHGFGYTTTYAHLNAFNVKKGQDVKRGECIGFVGNTGRSTAPHLHYEVKKNNKPINPIHYIFQDITSGEYEELLKLASIENQSLS